MESDPFHFLFIGNLLYMKGIHVLLESCQLLKNRQSRFICHIVGAPTGELGTESLQAIVQEKQLQKHIQIHGALYGNDKKQILEQCHAFVFPTLDDCFPLVVLEAMQGSLPVIASAEGAIPDIVEEGTTGILIEKQDSQGLAEAMEKLINNPGLVQSMGAAGRERYVRLFSRERFIECISDILRKA